MAYIYKSHENPKRDIKTPTFFKKTFFGWGSDLRDFENLGGLAGAVEKKVVKKMSHSAISWLLYIEAIPKALLKNKNLKT